MAKRISLTATAERMVDSLIEAAEQAGVDLSGITEQNFNAELDSRFNDGGEARCERFTDLAWEYSAQHGPLDSAEWDRAQWDAIKAALALLPTKLAERGSS
jgi:hypothetical protein